MTLKILKASTPKFRLISEEISEAKVFVEDSLLATDHEPKAEKHTSAGKHDYVFSEGQQSQAKISDASEVGKHESVLPYPKVVSKFPPLMIITR